MNAINERDFIEPLETADGCELATLLRRQSREEERALPLHLGDAIFGRLADNFGPMHRAIQLKAGGRSRAAYQHYGNPFLRFFDESIFRRTAQGAPGVNPS